jgi:mycothiol synthase
VAAPPALPADLVLAALTEKDVEDAAALLAEAEAVDDTGEHWSAEDLAEWWVNDLVDLARDGVAVRDRDGALVGWATALALPTFRDAFRIDLEARVHPPAVLAVSAPTTMPSLGALLRRAGFGEERWYSVMERRLDELPVAPAVDGVQLVPFSWDRDEEVRRAHNASFTAHHGSAERDATTWQTLFTGQRAFRSDLSVLALEDDAVVGYALGYVYEADSLARGYDEVHLGQIGVLPSARGRGLASALIAAVLGRAAGAGCPHAGLEVDTGNVTGALRLYESLGFRSVRSRVTSTLALPPLRDG